MKRLLPIIILTVLGSRSYGQFLMDMIDTTKETGRGMLAVYRKFDHLRIGGYIQPQFQWAQEKGIKSYEGGDFAAKVNNRFMLRRARVKIDYAHFGNGTEPGVQITFQFDGNERGFTVRDIWGRVFENNFQLFSFTAGMFARPFGYEVNLSSSDRESPERGRMSQTLMRSERDLGAMISLDARKKNHPLRYLKIDAGLFNGQGINAATDFDNKKDFIGRVGMKPHAVGKYVTVSGGASLLYGGLLQNTKYVYHTETVGNTKRTVVDSSATNLDDYSPRKYFGADAQIKIKNKVGFTELRAEFIKGTQTGSVNSSETPTALINGFDGFHIRNFNGAYFYFLQHLFSEKYQLVLKYDWYDPNTKISGNEISAAASLSAANIKYNTFGAGIVYYMRENIKLVLYYANVRSEKTQLPGFTEDVKDNVFTARLQFRF